MTTSYSPAPWSYGYNPYSVRSSGAEQELPAFEILDANQDKVFDTNEDTPPELQEANARLATAAPVMLETLRLAQRALNTAACFRVGDTDSYQIATRVDRAIAEAATSGITPGSDPCLPPRRFEFEHDPEASPERAYVRAEGGYDVAIVRTPEGIVVDVYPNGWMAPIDSLTVWDDQVAAPEQDA
jgi:hypothetical protein